MDRSRAARALGAFVTLLAAMLPLALVAAVRSLPAVAVDRTPLAWLPDALAVVLAATAAVAALAALAPGLRRGTVPILLVGGAAAAVAGGAVARFFGAGSLAIPVLIAAALLAASLVGVRLRPLDRRSSLVVAVGTLALAEAAALAEVLPVAAEAVARLRLPALVGAVGLSALAAGTSRGREMTVNALMAAAAAGLLADRGGGLESLIGLAALIGAQLLLIGMIVERGDHETIDDEARLPELAARLSDAVLRFDGGLRLRDWNAAASGLLGLQSGSSGSRIEDLLGVSIAELPPAEGSVVTRRAVGGLEVAVHRAGAGVTAVIRDPGATPEVERLGHELRSTIEELLRARRTIDLQRGELERSSTVDPLTGVDSRGAILERLRLEVAQARRYRHPLAVVLLDIDGFGELNRAHGIAGGDTVLREVALRIRLRVREADALGRAGSDGFLAALPHTDEAGAATFADALRHRLALRPIAIGDALVRVTVSIGVATMRPGEDLDLDGLLARVAEALASARRTGGDRIALDRLHGLARLEDPHRGDPDLPLPDKASELD